MNGNLASRTANGNSTRSTYTYDALDRVTHITHSLTGDTRTFDYGYDNVGNRSWTKRDGGTGDVFGYDLADQATAVKLDIANPDRTPPGAQTNRLRRQRQPDIVRSVRDNRHLRDQ